MTRRKRDLKRLTQEVTIKLWSFQYRRVADYENGQRGLKPVSDGYIAYLEPFSEEGSSRVEPVDKTR